MVTRRPVRKASRFLTLAALPLALLAVATSAMGRGETEMKTLKGIKSVYVVCERIDEPKVEEKGLTAEAITSLAERTLRMQGIKIATKDEWSNAYDIVRLYVNANTMVTDNGLVVYALEVSCQQTCKIIHNDQTVEATTWDDGSVGTVGLNNAREILDSIKNFVEKYAEDFQKANS
jgi:hypothetical protein